MSYRDPASALVSRRVRLVGELAEARRAAGELARTVERLTRLERELAETDALLASSDAGALPPLDHLRVASPCKADWDEMVGDDRVRFCGHCGKNVYNLSGMAREEAEALLREIEAAPCVRFFRRADGTVLTSDCPVGLRRKRTKQGAVAVGVSLLAGATGITAATLAPSEPPMAPVVDRSHAPREATPQVDEGPGFTTMGIPIFPDLDHRKLDESKPRPAGGRECTPPYEIDSRGKKRWKIECL